jgi:Raf kinase inhibitor-like YbhB/YbcL family protein
MSEAILIITSPAFENGKTIPSKYTCDGDNINPPLEIREIPHETQTLAIICEDPDAPRGVFDHWLVWNIPRTNTINENSNPGISGINGMDKTGYHGPCPPSGEHRYYFYVYALDSDIELPPGLDKKSLRQAMESHILARGELMGVYQRGR